MLDTHALIWAHTGVRIPKKVEKQLEAAGQRNQLFISEITPWELALGVRRGRIVVTARRLGASLVTADTEILAFANATRAIRVLKL